MNLEQLEKALNSTPKVIVERPPPPQNCIITEWIECPKSKAVLRFGHNAEKNILGVMWLNGTAEAYLYENVSDYYFNNAKTAHSVGKYLKSAVKYKRYTKVI